MVDGCDLNPKECVLLVVHVLQDAVCKSAHTGGQSFEVVGTVLFPQWLILVVYDHSLHAHTVYVVNGATMAIYLSLGTVSLKDSVRFAMTDWFGYDPAKSHSKLKIDWMQGRNPVGFKGDATQPNNPGQLYLLFYDPKKSPVSTKAGKSLVFTLLSNSPIYRTAI